MHARWAVIGAVLSVCLSFPAEAARWRQGPENLIEPNEYGATGTLAIGDGKDATWFWSTAWGISFRPDASMGDDQSSDELSLGKTAGGTCHWAMKFRFTKPVARFRCTTPLCSGLDLTQGDLVLYCAFDNDKRRELWRYGKNSPGYRSGSDATIEPVILDWIEPTKPAQTLTLYYEYVGYVGTVSFHANRDDGGVLQYTTAVLPPEEMVALTLIPDAKKIANVYRTDEAVRVLMDIGPTPISNPPELMLFDLGRQREEAARAFQRFGEDDWQIDLPQAQPGVYELRVLLTIGNERKTVKKGRTVLVHPPRKLSRAQELKSPFGVIGLDGEGAERGSAYVSGQDLARLIGMHQLRGGTMTWCVANPQKGVYDFGADPREMAEHDMKYGLVRRHSLAFSPGWTVDPKRVPPGAWSGHWPPKPEHLADYAEYCRRLAVMTKHYYVPEFEIWNEPNNEPHGSFKGTFEEFVAICHTAADAILAVNPEARMVLGSTGDADAGYIARLLQAGLSNKYRLVDIHPYRHTNQGPEDGLLVDIRRVRKVIADHGNNQGIVFTEVGWPTQLGDAPGYQAVTQLQQAHYFSRTLLISIAAGIERVHLFMLRDWGGDPKDPEHNFGMITCAGEPKLSIPAVATSTRHLEGAKFLGRAADVPEFHHVWYWRNPWMPGAVLATIWCDTGMTKGESQWVRLPAEPLASEDLWGGMPASDRLRREDRHWQVRPGEDPIFVYLPEAALPTNLAELPIAMRPWHLRRLNQD